MGRKSRAILIVGVWTVALAAVFGLLGQPALAIDTGLKNSATAAGIPTTGSGDVYSVIGTVIKAALGLVGIVFFVLMLYAGFIWMTAQGKADQVAKAKSMIVQAIIGLVIIFASYAITDFVLDVFLTSSTTTTTTTTSS